MSGDILDYGGGSFDSVLASVDSIGSLDTQGGGEGGRLKRARPDEDGAEELGEDGQLDFDEFAVGVRRCGAGGAKRLRLSRREAKHKAKVSASELKKEAKQTKQPATTATTSAAPAPPTATATTASAVAEAIDLSDSESERAVPAKPTRKQPARAAQAHPAVRSPPTPLAPVEEIADDNGDSGSSAAGPEAAPLAKGTTVSVMVPGKDKAMLLKLNPGDKFSQLFTTVAQLMKRPTADLVFKFRGLTLGPDKTPQDYFMDDEETVAVSYTAAAVSAALAHPPPPQAAPQPQAQSQPTPSTQLPASQVCENALRVKVVGPDNKVEKFMVRKTTTVRRLAEEYGKKTSVAVQLFFDGTALDPDSELGSHDIEDDDQIDAKPAGHAPHPNPQPQPQQAKSAESGQVAVITVDWGKGHKRFRIRLTDPVSKVARAVTDFYKGSFALSLAGTRLDPSAALSTCGVSEGSVLTLVPL